MRVGDLVKYSVRASSMLINLDFKLIGIVKKIQSAEFVVVLWSDGIEKVTFVDFLEVINEKFEQKNYL